jgi:hypothetical protein
VGSQQGGQTITIAAFLPASELMMKEENSEARHGGRLQSSKASSAFALPAVQEHNVLNTPLNTKTTCPASK